VAELRLQIKNNSGFERNAAMLMGSGSPVSKCMEVNPFSGTALECFCEGLIFVMTHHLNIDSKDSMRLATELCRSLYEDGEGALPLVSEKLHQTGIRAQWNQVLSQQRPSVIASWILPYCKGPVLDLLCGDGRVGERLNEHGFQVTLAERLESYFLDRKHGIPFIDFDHLKAEETPPFATVLLCTVLHHELMPEDLIRLGASLCRDRLIVIENCLDDRFSEECQLLFDIFFSRCLNSFELPTGGNHEMASNWLSRLSGYGCLRVHERRESLPGIPLPHDLLIIDM